MNPQSIFTAGRWRVKPGREADFISAWEAFARWTSENISGASRARLLQDRDQPGLFVSIGPWESLESVRTWRQTEEFREFVSRVRQLCESIEPHTLEQVTLVTRGGKSAA